MTTEFQVTKVGDKFTFQISQEVLQQIGVKDAEQISILVENDKIVLRPLARAELEQRVDEIVAGLLVKRKSAYEKLAEGA